MPVDPLHRCIPRPFFFFLYKDVSSWEPHMTPPGVLDPDSLRLPTADLHRLTPKPMNTPPCHRAGEKFLKGPIPWRWVELACRLPGQALAIGLILWQEAGCRKARKVSFRLSQARPLGMHPDTARRGLRALQAAKLVTIHRQPGRCLSVTLLDAAPSRP